MHRPAPHPAALAALALSLCSLHAGAAPVASASTDVSYHYATVDCIRIFYREAGDQANPTILLLHGFPSSSRMFRELMPRLATQFHLIAPDYPGMGHSEAPPADKFTASFDSVAAVTEHLVEQLGQKKVIVYEQDFGGPVGMRLAVHHPDWVAGLIIQNTPVSLDGWDPARLQAVEASAGPVTPEKRAKAEARVVAATAEYLHKQGTRKPDALNPDDWESDAYTMSKPESRRIMTDLQLDIVNNLALYDSWQAWLRLYQPKTLVVWGRADPIFAPAGALAVKKAVPSAEIVFYETGHFALEEDGADIARRIAATFAAAPAKRR
ncbi:MAG: alpha/beta fold hydrolase [Massilia sp.]